jgi:uncharacterized protein YjbI with pentapeptide repeats
MRFLLELRIISRRSRSAAVSLHDANLEHAVLSRMDPSDTNLQGVRLSHADLSGARLSRTNLSGADLSGADLSGADLTGAQGVTEERLAQAKSLEGATMPNGQKYEEWLRSKGRREDGEST